MLAGSMFGWNTPGANPQWYLDNARYVNSNIVQGHIKDPIMSVYYPVSSFLLCYEIMGKQHFYLPMDKLPQELMGQRSQFIMLPDMVCGVPVMPVTATFAQNESCTVQLERSCYVGRSSQSGIPHHRPRPHRQCRVCHGRMQQSSRSVCDMGEKLQK